MPSAVVTGRTHALCYNIYRSGVLETTVKDFLGMLTSFACLLHCLALPFILFFVSVGTAVNWHSGWVHSAFFAVALALAVTSLPMGFIRHRQALPLVLGGLGIILLTIGLFALPLLETPLTLSGVVLLAGGHWFNWQLLRRAVGAGGRGFLDVPDSL